MAKANRKQDLTTGALLPKIILFTLPLIATAVLQQLFNTADTVVVGRWGGDTAAEREIALAAVGSCGALTNLIVTLFFGLSVGAGVCVAHDIGAKHYDDVERVVHTSVLASLICGVFITAFGLCMARPLLTLMGTDPEVLDEAVPYMLAYFCGMPANILYNYCASMLRSSGDTTRPLVFLSVAGVVNVVLNLVMVLVFHTGALGVGIATAASHWVACVLIVRHMICTDGPCHFEFKKLRIHKDKLRKIILIGLPSGLQGVLFSFSNVIIQSSINSLGKVAVAGNTAASNIDSYIYTTQNALYHASITFVGQNVGARKFDRVRKSAILCSAVVTVVGVVVGAVAVFFGRSLLGIFTPDGGEVVEKGMIRLSIMGITYFLCGLMEVGSGALRGIGRSMESMVISLLGSCVSRIVWIYTVFAAIGTAESLYVSYPISWAATAAALFVAFFLLLRKKEQKELARREREQRLAEKQAQQA